MFSNATSFLKCLQRCTCCRFGPGQFSCCSEATLRPALMSALLIKMHRRGTQSGRGWGGWGGMGTPQPAPRAQPEAILNSTQRCPPPRLVSWLKPMMRTGFRRCSFSGADSIMLALNHADRTPLSRQFLWPV